MSFENRTVSIHYARTLIRAAERKGFDPRPLLQASRLSHDMLQSDEVRITPEQFSSLMKAVWRIEDDEFLGMSATPSRHGVFTLMAKYALHCSDLRAVYKHICHFYNQVNDAFILRFENNKNTASLSMRLRRPDLDPDHSLEEFLALLWHRFPSWLIGRRIPLNEVSFNFSKPAHVKEYYLLYPCPVSFDAPVTKLSFPSNMLDSPVVQTMSTLKEHLRRAPLDWFLHRGFYPTYTRLVFDRLSASDNYRNCSIEEVAHSLSITSRTLRRKLEEEHSSFQQIKNEVRKDLAIHLLAQRGLPIAAIAEKVGYSEAAAFTRAFKEWTGLTPRKYRSPFALR
jgi:AraC-like DNA-binding protein